MIAALTLRHWRPSSFLLSYLSNVHSLNVKFGVSFTVMLPAMVSHLAVDVNLNDQPIEQRN